MGGWGERCCAHSREVDSRQETHWATRNLKTYLQLLFAQQDSTHLKFHKVPTPPPNSATNQGPSVQTPELMGGISHSNYNRCAGHWGGAPCGETRRTLEGLKDHARHRPPRLRPSFSCGVVVSVLSC